MARDAKHDDSGGNWETWLDCPICDWTGLVYYQRRPPLYCSDACKQEAYRRRQKRNTPAVTLFLSELRDAGLTNHIPALERMVDRYGIEAAKEAAGVALAPAAEVRQLRRGY